MKQITSKTTVQAQYYSNITFDHEDLGWISVDAEKDHKSIHAAKEAIAAHCKKYHVTPRDRQFRIVTTIVTEIINPIV